MDQELIQLVQDARDNLEQVIKAREFHEVAKAKRERLYRPLIDELLGAGRIDVANAIRGVLPATWPNNWYDVSRGNSKLSERIVEARKWWENFLPVTREDRAAKIEAVPILQKLDICFYRDDIAGIESLLPDSGALQQQGAGVITGTGQELLASDSHEVAQGGAGGVIELNNYPLKGKTDAASHLGVSVKSISNYIDKGMPCLNPCRETGGKYRFNGEEIKAWHDQHQEGKRQKLLGNLKK